MKLLSLGATLSMLLLASCAPAPKLAIPPLNEEDAKRLTCLAWPDHAAMFKALPDYIFLTDRAGTVVVTDEGHKYVRYDSAIARNGPVATFIVETAQGAHFSCHDNLQWTSDFITGLQE